MGFQITFDSPAAPTSGVLVTRAFSVQFDGDETVYTTNVGTATTTTIEGGPRGFTGNGIESMTHLSGSGAPGTADVYRVLFTDGEHYDLTVQNGADGVGIVSITRTGGTGLAGSLDTYTVLYTDATTSTFTVRNGTNGTNGRGITGIARTSGDGSPGTTDTYTITYSDATTSTFDVKNGSNPNLLLLETGGTVPGGTAVGTIIYEKA